MSSSTTLGAPQAFNASGADVSISAEGPARLEGNRNSRSPCLGEQGAQRDLGDWGREGRLPATHPELRQEQAQGPANSERDAPQPPRGGGRRRGAGSPPGPGALPGGHAALAGRQARPPHAPPGRGSHRDRRTLGSGQQGLQTRQF